MKRRDSCSFEVGGSWNTWWKSASNLVEPPGIRSSTSCQPWRPPVSWRCAPWGHGAMGIESLGMLASPRCQARRRQWSGYQKRQAGATFQPVAGDGHHIVKHRGPQGLAENDLLIDLPQKWGGWMLETIDILWYVVCLFCFSTDSHHVWAKTTWTPMESLVVDQIYLGSPRWSWQRQGSEVPVFEVGAEVWNGWLMAVLWLVFRN